MQMQMQMKMQMKKFYCSIVLLFPVPRPNDLTLRNFWKKKKKWNFLNFEKKNWNFFWGKKKSTLKISTSNFFKMQMWRKFYCSIVLLFYCSMGHTQMTWDFVSASVLFSCDGSSIGPMFRLCVCVSVCVSVCYKKCPTKCPTKRESEKERDKARLRKFWKKNSKKKIQLRKFRLQIFSKCKWKNSIVLLFYCSMGHAQMTWDLEILKKILKKNQLW